MNFKTYYKATVIKTVWYWQKNKHMDQWKRTVILEIEILHIWLIFNKDIKSIHQKKIVLSINTARTTDSHMPKLKQKA